MKTKYPYFLSFVLLAGLLLTACGGAATQPVAKPTAVPQTTLTISGAGGASAILKYLAEAYSTQHDDLAFEFLSGTGSSGGVKGVLTAELDLGATSRPPKDAELAEGIQYLPFGTDNIVIVTSPDLSITSLTSQQVKDIFLGTITNWSEVGGPDALISVLVRDEDDTNTTILRKAIFGDAPFVAGAAVFTGEGDLKTALVSTTNAVGYLAYSGVTLGNLSVHSLVIDGQDPANVGGSYPYFRPAGVVYVPANAVKVQPFLDYIVSAEAQALLVSEGIAPPK